MRILWITQDTLNEFYPYVKGKPNKSASWTSPLFYNLQKNETLQLGSVVSVTNGEVQKECIKNVPYYSIPIKYGGNLKLLPVNQVKMYKKVIADFQPDIIHIHGVEFNFGLLRKHIDSNIPIVCSIQGLINPCYLYLKYSVAAIDLNKYRSLKNLLGRGGFQGNLKRWRGYINIEKEIVKINDYFIGRTLWDKSQLAALNPSAHYFHGEELLREPFYSNKWNIKDCISHRVFISSSITTIKGFHILLEAAAILKRSYPHLKIVAPLSDFSLKSSKLRRFLLAEDYSNYLREKINRLNLAENVILLPKLNADEMAVEFKKAHVFVLASFIENSPNALGEAMSIGTPSVVSPVGGVMSMVKDEESALIFPSGDYNMLAFQIDRIFKDDKLAEKLSENSKKTALKRHDVNATTIEYVDIYNKIIQLHKQV